MKTAAKAAAFDTFLLNNGNRIPCLGLGTYTVTSPEHMCEILQTAHAAGFRLIDSARMYDNEDDIGWSLRSLTKTRHIPRSDFFITSKILPGETSYKSAYAAVSDSLKSLQTDYIDLMLIHWPTNSVKGRVGCWKAMQELHKKGVLRNIGVSNFTKKHLESLRSSEGVTIEPCVNQIEVHPRYIDAETIQYCHERNIILEAYCPFKQNAEDVMKDPILRRLAKGKGKSVAQVVLRWLFQRGIVALPRSNNVTHVQDNAAIFDFALTAGEMLEIEGLNDMSKCDWDPYSIDK